MSTMSEIKEPQLNNDEIDLFQLVKEIWSFKKAILMISSICAVLAVIYVLTLDNIYTAKVTMLPQNNDNKTSSLSGLAALAGVDLGNSSSSNEAFYKDVILSNKILDKLISQKWTLSDGKEVDLKELIGIEKEPLNQSNYELKLYLRSKAISFSTSSDNGLMTLSVALPLYPQLSSDIANWISKELHLFNEKYRQQKAQENYYSIEKQLQDSKDELSKTELTLKNFINSNRDYSQSADLRLEYARLEREVLTENTVYTELRKQFEIAKIDLEKSKESIYILDDAITPVMKSGPKRSIIVISITLFSVFFSIVILLIRNKIKGIH